jgi:subtilisin family serine protease
MWGIRGGLVALCGLVAAAVLFVAGAAGANGLVPDDPYYAQQWAPKLLDMPELWKYSTGDPSVVIAMVDTGVNYSIKDLEGQFVQGWDMVDNDPISEDTSPGRHGTYVSAALAARGNNASEIAGYCWGCKIMPVRVSRGDKVSNSAVAAGIRWAVEHGARIITVGFSSDVEDFEVLAAVRYAREKGVLVIASSGNTGKTEPRYPAAYPEVLSAAATDDADRIYFWSTRGSWVDLAAPGCAMIVDPTVGPGTQCGTSFTPAVVAGIAGILVSLKPSLTDDELFDLLVRTAKPIPGVAAGRIDPVAAVRALGIPEPQPASTPSTSTPAPGQTTPAPAATASVARGLSFRSGVMRARIARSVRVGRGRLEVHFQASRASECQILVAAPKNELILSLLRPVDPTLRSLSVVVGPGAHRVEVLCDPARRRSYRLSISAQLPKTT